MKIEFLFYFDSSLDVLVYLVDLVNAFVREFVLVLLVFNKLFLF